jgi:hypothetical protein
MQCDDWEETYERRASQCGVRTGRSTNMDTCVGASGAHCKRQRCALPTITSTRRQGPQVLGTKNQVLLARPLQCDADLVAHVGTYVEEVTALLYHSLLPSIRTRLCACLSQGMLLIGANFYDAGQFQTARVCFQTALEAAHEADNPILKAETWCWDSYSWMRGNEPNRYQHALDSMLKACGFASLGSDLAVQSRTLAGSAEVYGYLKEKSACVEALKNATKLGGYERGDYYHVHQFDDSHLNGCRGFCLQQFDQSSDPETDSLL